MTLKGILSAVVFFASVSPAFSQAPGLPDSAEPASLSRLGQVLSQDTNFTDSAEPLLFTTIEQGQAGRFGADNPEVQPVFSDLESWKSFWEAYTEGREPRPALPPVDFNSEMVLVSALSAVAGVYVDRSKGILYVSAAEPEPAASSPQATTSFHIIKTEKLEFESVVFERPTPAQGLITGEETRDGADINAPATPEDQTQDLSARRPAPPCLHLDQWNSWSWWKGWKSHARAINRCGHIVRFRMIWAWAFDGACHSVRRSWYEERRGKIPYVSELRAC